LKLKYKLTSIKNTGKNREGCEHHERILLQKNSYGRARVSGMPGKAVWGDLKTKFLYNLLIKIQLGFTGVYINSRIHKPIFSS